MALTTFEQLYKRVLEIDIDTATSNAFDVRITNDINVILSGRSPVKTNGLFAIIESGKGNSFNQSGHNMVQQQMMIMFYVPQNNAQAFLKQLTDYALAKSKADKIDIYLDVNNNIYFTAGVGRTLTYSYNVLFTTPYVNPSLVNTGHEINYQEIVLIGNFVYDDTLTLYREGGFAFQFVSTGIIYVTIDNVVQHTIASSILGEKSILGTSQTTYQHYDGDDQVISLIINFNPTSTVHGLLRQYALQPQPQKAIRVLDYYTGKQYDGDGFIRVNASGGRDIQSTFSVQIIVSGLLESSTIGGGV